MARVIFIPSIQRNILCGETQSTGGTVQEVLDGVFAAHPEVRDVVLDDHSILRKCIAIFVDGDAISDRVHLSDAVSETSSVHVLQPLSGG